MDRVSHIQKVHAHAIPDLYVAYWSH